MRQTLYFGDVVLINFPFTRGQSAKKRPALVLKDCDDGDVITCRITSQNHSSEFDVNIQDWQAAGLRLPSVIRVQKLATLEKSMIQMVLGQIDEPEKQQVRDIFSKFLD